MERQAAAVRILRAVHDGAMCVAGALQLCAGVARMHPSAGGMVWPGAFVGLE